jgi:TPR repeat protein
MKKFFMFIILFLMQFIYVNKILATFNCRSDLGEVEQLYNLHIKRSDKLNKAYEIYNNGNIFAGLYIENHFNSRSNIDKKSYSEWVLRNQQSEIVKILENLSENDPCAAVELSDIYEKGRYGIKKDNEKGAKLLLKAKSNGILRAYYKLGIKYLRGLGDVIEQDTDEGIKLIYFAAENGYPEAMFDLGVIYVNDKFTEQDIIESLKWYNKAIESGNDLAMCDMATLLLEGIAVKRDKKLVIKLLKTAAEEGNLKAEEEHKKIQQLINQGIWDQIPD